MIFLNHVQKIAANLHPHDAYDFLCIVDHDPWESEKTHTQKELVDLIVNFCMESEKHYFLLLQFLSEGEDLYCMR